MKTIKKINVSNLQSSSGNDIANQFEIRTPDGVYFQSYDSIIAFMEHKTSQMYLDEYYWNYSTTTGKYRNIWLGEDRKETKRKIKSGQYKLVNLNK